MPSEKKEGRGVYRAQQKKGGRAPIGTQRRPLKPRPHAMCRQLQEPAQAGASAPRAPCGTRLYAGRQGPATELLGAGVACAKFLHYPDMLRMITCSCGLLVAYPSFLGLICPSVLAHVSEAGMPCSVHVIRHHSEGGAGGCSGGGRRRRWQRGIGMHVCC